MILDCILVVVLALFVVLGLRRGGLAAGVSLCSIFFAYAGGLLGARFGGEFVASQAGFSPFVATPLAGLAGFVLGYLVVGIVGGKLVSWQEERLEDDDEERGAMDRLAGGLIGGLHGGLVVILLAWLAIWVDAARDLDLLTLAKRQLPQTEHSRFAGVTSKVIEEVAARALASGEEGEDAKGAGVRVITRLLATPGSALSGLREILEDERISKLQQDRMFWVLIENGASDNALNRLSFYQISHDPLLRGHLADLGIVSSKAAESVTAFHDEAAQVFDEVGPKLRGLREDPAILAMSKDPAIISMLERGDTLALIQHPEIQRLVDRIAAGTP